MSSWSISEEEKPSNKDKEHCYQQAADVGTVTNLITEDAYNVMNFFWIVHYIWAVPLKVRTFKWSMYGVYFNTHHREKNVYQIIQILSQNKLQV